MDDALTLRQLYDFPGGLELHLGMYIPALRANCNPEQLDEFLPPALALTTIGTYAQVGKTHPHPTSSP